MCGSWPCPAPVTLVGVRKAWWESSRPSCLSGWTGRWLQLLRLVSPFQDGQCGGSARGGRLGVADCTCSHWRWQAASLPLSGSSLRVRGRAGWKCCPGSEQPLAGGRPAVAGGLERPVCSDLVATLVAVALGVWFGTRGTRTDRSSTAESVTAESYIVITPVCVVWAGPLM